MLNGQVNLRDAIRRQIDFETGGKSYKLIEHPAVLIVRCVYALFSLYPYTKVDAYMRTGREDGISTSPAC